MSVGVTGKEEPYRLTVSQGFESVYNLGSGGKGLGST